MTGKRQFMYSEVGKHIASSQGTKGEYESVEDVITDVRKMPKMLHSLLGSACVSVLMDIRDSLQRIEQAVSKLPEPVVAKESEPKSVKRGPTIKARVKAIIAELGDREFTSADIRKAFEIRHPGATCSVHSIGCAVSVLCSERRVTRCGTTGVNSAVYRALGEPEPDIEVKVEPAPVSEPAWISYVRKHQPVGFRIVMAETSIDQSAISEAIDQGLVLNDDYGKLSVA